MARIRSVHPSLWTDEDFVSMKPEARLFLIGLWNEADDYGLFEWKPVTLKMRLAPADNVDAAELMEAISSARFITKISCENKVIGVISNFRKYQRPQKPSSPIIPITQHIAKLICLDVSKTPKEHLSEGYNSPTGIAPQMDGVVEDGIGEEGNISSPSSAREAKTEIAQRFIALRDKLWPNEISQPAPRVTIETQVAAHLETGVPPPDLWAIIEHQVRGLTGGPPKSLAVFKHSLPKAIAAHKAAQNPVEVPSHDGTGNNSGLTRRQRERAANRASKLRVLEAIEGGQSGSGTAVESHAPGGGIISEPSRAVVGPGEPS